MAGELIQAPESTALTRDESGRFPKGVSGNPAGRPKGRKTEIKALREELEHAFVQHVSPEKIKRIIDKMVEKAAIDGSVGAAKLIFEHVIAKAGTGDDDGNDGRTVVFRIENATFAAVQATATKQSNVIDATVEEVHE